MAQRLEKYIVRDALCSRIASGAITGKRLVTLDLSADAEGGKVAAIDALADIPFGAVEDSAAAGAAVGVIRGAGSLVALECVDASIAVDVVVYNDIAGKVSSTQGAGASRVGRTRSAGSGAGELVTVELDLPV